MTKLHIGCGLDLKIDYINIDSETKENMLKRYSGSSNEAFINYRETGIEIFNYDIFNLPFEDSSIDEVLCNAFLEHLSFEKERIFFLEMKKKIKTGGLLKFSVPDFEWIISKWINAKDEWLDFWYSDKGEHWFGQNNRNMESRWGYLTATIFGNQASPGQFHKNAYTKNKIEALAKKIGFSIKDFNESFYRDKYDKMLNYTLEKQ